ncbi:GDSL esterase/lipase EXL3 [Rhynchospora pubera]|uniref:GDSL esterase/lipase EXL3 n=1 Tax=Rhynchospora pubera TaxID=906938 RepID=A0AAV8GJG5_9POAL|nr:GDSL esterase/lipase EXL3 [Rhynchospora pubera]
MECEHLLNASTIALCIFIFIQQVQHISATAANTKTKAPAVLIFGDSNVDAGNNNAIFTLVKSDHPPYGQNFPHHLATGRFSNGRNPGDMIASLLGIKDYVPAYQGTNLTEYDLLTGVSFASGGAGYDPLTSELVQVLSMDDQIKMFKEYKQKIKAIVGEKIAEEIISKSLYVVVSGATDLANTYFTTPFRRNYDLSSYNQLLVQFASKFYQDLYNLGARRISVTGMPPIGSLPSQRTNAGGIERNTVPLYNQASVMYNADLLKETQRLNKTLPGVSIVFQDLYTPILDMAQRPSAYGFEVTDRGCCGTGIFEITLTCNRYTSEPCKDPSKFLFWDTFHLTEKGYTILISELVARYGLNVG